MTQVTTGTTANSLLWSGVENGSLAVISLGSLVVYSQLLSAAEFGLFSIVLALTEMLGILVTMLFHDALVQRRDVTDLHFDTAFTVTAAISFMLMIGCWAAAPVFTLVTHQPDAGRVLGWMGLMFPSLALSATIVAQQRRQFAFRSLAIRSLSGRVFGGVAGIAAAFLHAGIWSLVLQQVGTAIVGSVVLWLTCARTPKLRFGRQEFRQLVTFGAFSVTNLFLSFSIKRLFTIVAGLRLGVATAGYLNLGFRIVDVLWAISATAVSQVSLPMLSGLQSDTARLKRAYAKSVEFACLLLFPCFAGIAVTAPEIVACVFGPKWAPASGCVAALACLVLVQAPRLFATPVLTAVGRPRDPLVGVVAELAVMLLLLSTIGVYTLPWAIGIWIASECSQIPVSTWMLRRATGYGVVDQFAGARTPLLAVATLALAVTVARHWLPVELAVAARRSRRRRRGDRWGCHPDPRSQPGWAIPRFHRLRAAINQGLRDRLRMGLAGPRRYALTTEVVGLEARSHQGVSPLASTNRPETASSPSSAYSTGSLHPLAQSENRRARSGRSSHSPDSPSSR